MQKTKSKKQYKLHYIANYILLTATLSFIGWLYEVLLVRVRFGHWSNRGFLWLPFCPIYGLTLTFVYFFMGTPNEKHGILKNIENPTLHTTLYLFFAFIIPTAAELFVGLLFDKAFHISLWSYSSAPLNFHGYISLPISLLWSALIYLFMRFFFLPLKKWVFRLPNKISIMLATLLITSVFADIIIQFIRI